MIVPSTAVVVVSICSLVAHSHSLDSLKAFQLFAYSPVQLASSAANTQSRTPSQSQLPVGRSVGINFDFEFKFGFESRLDWVGLGWIGFVRRSIRATS